MTAQALAPIEAPKKAAKVKTMNNAVRTISASKKVKIEPLLPQTLAEYSNWEPEDGFKYEWVREKLLKLEPMKENELHIMDNLMRLFMTTQAFLTGDTLMPEIRSKTTEKQRRIPDAAYFTIEQKIKMYDGKSQVPRFAVEIISPSNDAEEMATKLVEYLENGVEIVWYIHPQSKMVFVYDSLSTFQVCRGEDICSAEKVIEGFKISVKDLFKKPSIKA